MHAAVLAINSAVDQDDPAELLLKLRNPAAMIDLVEEENAQRYLAVLTSTKEEKAGLLTDKDDIEEADAYDYMLTQTEIQDCVARVNTQVKREVAEAKCELTPPTVTPTTCSIMIASLSNFSSISFLYPSLLLLIHLFPLIFLLIFLLLLLI